MSKFEDKIKDILQRARINFECEKTFQDLRHGTYRFDFYLPNSNIVLECNGMQHYDYVKAFFPKRSDFSKAQERDRRKIAYCLARNIKIYCIPCWEMDNIQILQDLFRPEFEAKSKFHNDDAWRRYQKSLIG